MGKLQYKAIRTLLLTSTLPIALVSIITIIFIGRIAVQGAHEKLANNLNIAQFIYRNVQEDLKYKVRDQNRRISIPLENGEAATLRAELKNISQTNGFDFFIVTDNKGKVIISISNPQIEGKDFTRNYSIGRTLGGEAFASSEILGEYDLEMLGLLERSIIPGIKKPQGLVIQASLPIINRKEEIIGTMSAGYLLNNNNKIIIDEIKAKTGLISSIFLDDLRVCSSVPSKKGEYAVGKRFSLTAALPVIKQGKTHIGRMPVIGQWFLAGYAPIYNNDKEVIGILGIGIPEADIFVLRNRLIGIFGLIVLLSLSSSLIFGFIRGRNIAGSIIKIANAAKAVSKGYLEHEVKINSKDEIEELGNFFNQMTQQLKTNRQQLNNLIAGLGKEKNKLEIILKANNDIGSIMILEDLSNFVTEQAIRLVEAEKSSLMLVDEISSELVLKGSAGLNKEKITLRSKIGELIAGWVAKEGEALVVRDIDNDPRLKQYAKASRYKTKSFISLPLKTENRVIGVMNVTDKLSQTKIFTEDDLKLLTLIAHQTVAQIENIRLYEKLSSLAITDALTGLFNHRYFQERLQTEIMRAERYKHSLSLIMFDIDSFKACNDYYGHLEGDKALKRIALIINESVRHVDIVSRYGGEEFTVILPDTDLKGAVFAAEKIRKTAEELDLIQREPKKGFRVTLSGGVAVYQKGLTKDELISHVDEALYKAKREGRNRICVFKPKSAG